MADNLDQAWASCLPQSGFTWERMLVQSMTDSRCISTRSLSWLSVSVLFGYLKAKVRFALTFRRCPVSVAGIPGCELPRAPSPHVQIADLFSGSSLGRTGQLSQRIRQRALLAIAFCSCEHDRDDSLPFRLFLLVCFDHVLGYRKSPPSASVRFVQKSWYP